MLALKLFSICGVIISVYGLGEISILQSPDSISFSGQEQLELSAVKNVLSSALGFSVPEGSRWSGMVVKDPFNFADAVAIITVPGIASLDSVQGRTFPLLTDELLHKSRQAMFWRLIERYPTSSSDNLTNVEISLDKPETAEAAYGTLMSRDSPSLEFLKLEIPEDKAFIDQINTMDAITAKIADKGLSNDGIPDIHWINIPGVHTLVDTYGAQSKQVMEAKRLLSSSSLLLSEVFNTAYNDKVLFSVVSSDAVHTRRFRREAQATDKPVTAPKKQSKEDEEFPVMFNIFLWFGITFVFVLLATTVGIATMDPGRDTIIYRMTSNRMKKD